MATRAGFTAAETQARQEFEDFARHHITPYADAWDRAEEMPEDFIERFAAAGHLGATIPARYGGAGHDPVTVGLLCEETGRACSSVRSLITVHGMAAHAVRRFGTAAQRAHWLPRMARGEAIGAFALTESAAGSDMQAVTTTARRDAGGYVIDGHKRWTTFGLRADVLLVFARLDGMPAAFLVARGTPGLEVRPVRQVLGTRASMIADITLADCRVPAAALLGRPGFGFAGVAADALEFGRYSVAWGCAGLAQACLDACLDHAHHRVQFGARLRDHQLVRRKIADMATATSAARLLCQQAGRLRAAGDGQAVHATWMAKYFASTTAFQAATDAVQLHGAAGIGGDRPVQRYLRDAKVMEVIEGSTELQQITIGDSAYHDHIPAGVPAGRPEGAPA
ncbi:acyl-CoA dehydrogenase family protein [Streptomyces humi]